MKIPVTIDRTLDYMVSLWEREECYRYYAKQRRLNCNHMEIMDLWVQAPYCVDCNNSSVFPNFGPGDISPDTWELDIICELGPERLEATQASLQEDPSFFFSCKKCLRELRPWDDDDVFVVSYHLEEHYGIPLETPGRKNPSKKIVEQILKMYEYKCFACNSASELHIDHIKPRSKGGDSAFRNLQPLCTECGNKKGDLLPRKVVAFDDTYFGGCPSSVHAELFW